VLEPERTFWEKVTLLHAVNRSGKMLQRDKPVKFGVFRFVDGPNFFPSPPSFSMTR
jgi:hypothetical protein